MFLQGCLKCSARLIRTDQCTLTSPEGWKVCSDCVSLKIYLTMGIKCPWENDPGKALQVSILPLSSPVHQNCHRRHYHHTAADVLSPFERVVSINYIIYETILAITTTSQFIINTFGRFFFLQSNIYLKVNQNS